MMIKPKFSIVALVMIMTAIFVVSGDAQRLVSSTSNGVVTPAIGRKAIEKHFKDIVTPEFTENIRLQKIVYTSIDENGRPINLSGLVAMPASGATKGLIVYMHGTLWNRKASPSRMTAKTTTAAYFFELAAFATGGYAIAFPDYIGLGDNMQVHPYPLNIVNGQSGVDIIPAARQLARNMNYRLSDKLFVTGYSEGGGTAMGLTKLLQDKNDPAFRVERSAPMSGPYDLTGATRDYLVEEAKGTELIARAYLLGYCVKYFKDKYGVNVDDYFTKSMSRAVNTAFKDGRSDKDILLRLALVSTLTGSARSVEKLLTKRFINALETLDRSDPLIRELAKNNVFDWRPRTEMLLQNLKSDNIVSPVNTYNTIRAMRANGIGPNRLRHIEIVNDKLDHGTVATYTTLNARRFFDEGFAGVPDAK